VDRLGAAALATHAGMGTLLALATTVWFSQYLQKGLTGRAGPKLPDWAKKTAPRIAQDPDLGIARSGPERRVDGNCRALRDPGLWGLANLSRSGHQGASRGF